MLTGDAYSSGHLIPSHLGLAYVLFVETNPFPELVVIFSGLFTSKISRYFLDFASQKFSFRKHFGTVLPEQIRTAKF